MHRFNTRRRRHQQQVGPGEAARPPQELAPTSGARPSADRPSPSFDSHNHANPILRSKGRRRNGNPTANRRTARQARRRHTQNRNHSRHSPTRKRPEG